jgi:peptide-methionine (S)-S-oxide reductase
VGVGLRSASAAEKARVIPAPAQDEPAGQATSDVAVLAAGCFWGVQGVYQHVKGVDKALSGYTGGSQRTAHYEIVGWGNTGHAESVQITFDPRQITSGKILQIFFSVVHDPTQLNRQGPDTGTQYRSAIFPLSAEQNTVAKAYIAQLNEARVFGAAIVTKIEIDRPFIRPRTTTRPT